MRPALLVAAVALVLAALAAGAAEDESREVQIVAHEDPANCVADEAPCYEVVDDGWSLVSGGERLEIVFENNASAEHALNIAAGENATEERATNASAAFAELGPIEPGETTNATVQIPRGTDTAYLYCHLGDHEAQGLHLLRNVYPAGSVEEGRNSGPGLDEPNDSSVPLALALVSLAGAGLAIRDRRV